KVWTVVHRGGRIVVETCGEVLGEWHDDLEAARAIRSSVELWAAEQSNKDVAVHAAVLAFNDRAIVLPGRSGIGKSTLALALIRAGATYYSDEFAVFNRQAEAIPYPRPLAVRRAQADGGVGVDHIVPSQVGAVVGDEPVAVKLIADLPFDPGLDSVACRELPPALGALSLIENAVAARAQPEAVLDIAARVAGEALTLVGKRGPSEQAAEFLLRCIQV
ncbi:MAG TPA: hypothetical protein VFV02_02940, partial [Acidimicrobiales bacterium]|nr:hypothetical protein [Acidimicrobiales bacterium]